MKKKSIIRVVLITLSILAIPFIAMQFNEQVAWSKFDFLVVGTLLLSLGLSIEIILDKVKSLNSRFIFIAVIVITTLLVWIELAVGLFNSPFAGN